MWPTLQEGSLTRPAQHFVQGLTARHEATQAGVRQGVSPISAVPRDGISNYHSVFHLSQPAPFSSRQRIILLVFASQAADSQVDNR